MSDTPKVPDTPEVPDTPKGGELSPESKGLLRDLQAQREVNKTLKDQMDGITKAAEEAETVRLTEQNEFKTLYEAEQVKVAELSPLVDEYKTVKEARKTVLLEQLGEDAKGLEDWGLPQLEVLAKKLDIKLANPPLEPGSPGMSPAGEFGGYASMNELALAATRDPKARELYEKLRGR